MPHKAIHYLLHGANFLTDDEYERWKKSRPNDWDGIIDEMSRWLDKNGKTYVRYYSALQDWADRKDKKYGGGAKQEHDEYIPRGGMIIT